MSDPVFFIDISTQLNDEYTGIGNVNHQIIKWYRAEHPHNSIFFCYDHIIEDTVIDELIVRKSGVGLRDMWERRLITRELLSAALERQRERPCVGLFSTAKTSRRLFDYEAQVIHDLTVLLMPEYHRESTIDHHGTSIEEDLTSDDLVICVSASTRDDLELYLGVPQAKMLVAHLGIDHGHVIPKVEGIEPFVLVLGTVEPRKNIALILATLRARPDLLAKWRFVFVGHDGWGKKFTELLMQYNLAEYQGGRILHLGFVSDLVRDTLLSNASCLLYPSFYEGFGLPVLEGLRAGCAVIISRSSSLVEVGGPEADYIDPYSHHDLARALDKLEGQLKSSEEELLRSRAARQAWARRFNWNSFCEAIYTRICDDLR